MLDIIAISLLGFTGLTILLISIIIISIKEDE